ncbi:hypothetical protein [Clostridium tagluense]|uniref:Guanylate cyclase domain-containing protein n=1 Tax=Clostridium tagluense TaxID=360422 RepID=A0A401UUJ4_9CLOT|nr:hypothetical protein [Clostridium tagluense]GCD13118.1 hypothetical protein Ctaglu_47410 [Clostridium tagluense]
MYRKHIVAFMDILGFKQLITNAEQGIDDAMLIINKLTNSIEMVMEENRFLSDISYRIFSDCICISYDISNVSKERIVCNIQSFLEQIICIQAQLVLEGIFLRGAICIDNHFENENIIFSQALVKAYELESTKALYPRILVDDSVIEYLKKNNIGNSSLSFEFYGKITRDLDGLNFIDYLDYCSVLGIEYCEDEFLKNHKELIESRLRNESDLNVLQKYLWLTRYHNFKVKEEDLSKKYKIGEDFFLFFNKDVFI